MNTSIILLIVGVFLAVGVIIYFLTRHKKTTVSTKSISNTQDMIIGDENVNVIIPVLISIDGNYLLKPQDDGNLVVYDKAGKYYWNSYFTDQNSFPRCDPVNSCTYTTQLQPDGNLVTYSSKNNTTGTNYTWSAAGYPGTNFKKRSDSSAPYVLKFYNTGQLGIYDSNNNVIWSSGDVPSHIPVPPPPPIPGCSGPDFTGKTWKNIYKTDTSGVIVHFDIDTNNPSNMFVVEAQPNYVGLPIFTLHFSKNNGNEWTVINPNTFGVQPWYICEYGKFFKNFQMTCGNTVGDEMPFIMFSRDMFNTVASKTIFNPSPAPTYLRIDTSVFGGKNKVCSSDDGLIHFISASSLPGFPGNNTYGFLKLTIDSSFNVIDTTWTVKKGAVNMACSSDAKYVLLTWSDGSNVVAELSQDYGKTWTTVDSNNSQYRTNAYNAFVSSNGDVIVYSYNITNDQLQTTSYTKVSFDFGKSWITLNIDNNLDSYNISDSGWTQIYSINNESNVVIKYSNHLGNSIIDSNLPSLNCLQYFPTKLCVSKDYKTIAISTDTNIYLLTPS